jgi:hypothetical protein
MSGWQGISFSSPPSAAVLGWCSPAGPIAGLAWSPVVYCAVVAAGAAIGGLLLEPRRWRVGLVSGALAGAGGLGALAWALERWPATHAALACVLGLAGLAPGVGLHYLLKYVQIRVTIGWRQDQSARSVAYEPLMSLGLGTDVTPLASGSTMHIFYDPPPDPQDAALEERLLFLCKQNRRLLQRLVDYERRCQPHLRRGDLLRLAIEHFERDNR